VSVLSHAQAPRGFARECRSGKRLEAAMAHLFGLAGVLSTASAATVLVGPIACSSSPTTTSMSSTGSGSTGASGSVATSGARGAGAGTEFTTGASAGGSGAGTGSGTATMASAGESTGGAASTGAGGSGATSGSGTGSTSGGSGATGEPSEAGAASTLFELTSPDFVGVSLDGGSGDGGPTIPSLDTCADPDGGGLGVSPELAWTAGPSATMSYTIVLTDLTNKLNHWAVWNIPPSVLSLPMALPKGAMLQSPAGALQQNFQGNPEYIGPCPAGATHIYEFEIFAIPSTTLTGIKSGASTAQVYAEAVKDAAATATLIGRSDAKN
jgi:Raf kinase inhibitor-like YbhB/YbcL family protein